jgi:phospholipase C
LMMENRSFDHYLGALRLAEGRAVDGLVGTEWNPDPTGSWIGVHQLDDFTPADPPHDWNSCHEAWNLGSNDGFVIAHAGSSQNDVMGYHVRSQIPTTYALADAGVVCDRWYSSVMGPTWPNRFLLHGATSNGIKANVPIPFGANFTSIFETLTAAGITNTNYYHDIPWALGAYQKTSGNKSIDKFFEDAAAATLPTFALIDPQFFGSGANDDHPDHDVQLGQALLASVYAALAASPQWSRTLFIVTYDEHGGFYDHVSPPSVGDSRVDFQRLGFRVPSIVLGPYVRQGCTVGTTFEHVSILKTLQTRFGIAPLNARMDAATDLSSCIDPAKIGAPAAPMQLPMLSISASRLRARLPSVHAHAELAEALRHVAIPPGIDRRSTGIGETAHVLRWGEKLGALRMR